MEAGVYKYLSLIAVSLSVLEDLFLLLETFLVLESLSSELYWMGNHLHTSCHF